jgi:SHAQKYF class myb-like DNA-binding protein
MARPKRAGQVEEDGGSTGRWTTEEHQLFEDGLRKYGKQWKRIAEEIPTRTVVQIRTHAQKYFLKLAKIEPATSTSIALKPPAHHNRNHAHAHAHDHAGAAGASGDLPLSLTRKVRACLRGLLWSIDGIDWT